MTFERAEASHKQEYMVRKNVYPNTFDPPTASVINEPAQLQTQSRHLSLLQGHVVARFSLSPRTEGFGEGVGYRHLEVGGHLDQGLDVRPIVRELESFPSKKESAYQPSKTPTLSPRMTAYQRFWPTG